MRTGKKDVVKVVPPVAKVAGTPVAVVAGTEETLGSVLDYRSGAVIQPKPVPAVSVREWLNHPVAIPSVQAATKMEAAAAGSAVVEEVEVEDAVEPEPEPVVEPAAVVETHRKAVIEQTVDRIADQLQWIVMYSVDEQARAAAIKAHMEISGLLAAVGDG